jgi:Animal haem peroxidase.
MGMASQLSEKEDAVLCSDIRDKLFGPNEFSRRDLGALNIMRGRDNGIADYNTVSFWSYSGEVSLTQIKVQSYKTTNKIVFPCFHRQ